MTVSSSTAEKTENSPSGRSSDAAASESSSLSGLSATAETAPKDAELQRQTSMKSEEYRQLFRLPTEEVLIRDYNCALQENFLLQGHMYVFDHYICFYSNLFGFETKKVIPIDEVTAVRRAKSAGIFPTAIEILAGDKKYFFTSFLSRDDAFYLIKDGWSQYENGENENTDLQGTKLEIHSQDNGDMAIEKASSSKNTVEDVDISERQEITKAEDSKIPVEIGNDIVSFSGVQRLVEETVYSAVNNSFPSSRTNLVWVEENCDAPRVSDSCTKVAESKFPIRVEEFFTFFYSDDAVGFLESFHQRCGDIDFKCSSWRPHEKFSYTRDLFFRHPIKIYLGAKCGTCQEVQKYRVYKNSHLVIETMQNVTDVPYGDYFHVEWLWDVERDGDDSKRSCILRVYVNVVFSKSTMFKGRIVQGTIDEARDAYTIWIKNAHELLKRKKLEEEEAEGSMVNSITNGQEECEDARMTSGRTAQRPEPVDDKRTQHLVVGSDNDNNPTRVFLPGSSNSSMPFSLFREFLSKLYASLKIRNHVPKIIVIGFALILLLMQLSIVVLLSRPQKVQLVSHLDYYSRFSGERKHEMMAWMDKRIQHFKEEMLMVESLIDKMRHEHKHLKSQLDDIERFRRLQME